MSRQFTEKTVPRDAFRAELGQFKAGDTQENKTPFSMLGRSNKPVMHWYWGAIYHDFDGMQVADSIPVDYCHEDGEIMGYADKFDVGKEGLEIRGALVHHHEGDRVDDVTHKAKHGVPYQASIDFRGDNVLAEQVNEGFTAQVNGETIEGPALIFRQWPLIGMAVCPHGRDANTRTQFSEEDGDGAVIRIFSEGAMPKAKSGNAATKPEKQQTTPAGDAKPGDNKPAAEGQQSNQGENAPAAEQQQTEEPGDAESDDAAAQFKAELKKFTDKFGAENGTKWYVAGKSYTEALELHNEALNRQLAKRDEDLKAANDKLGALHNGEETPASFSNDETEETPDGQGGQQANRFAHMGKVGAFASALKMPGK